ncbi:MAG: AAA family ATPase [Myxococcales bacterium]|nr:AAA family ATPase [Myxococcales bacterium]
MRLHRIHTTNLNSLYGEQCVDLDRDLQGAGLFLIQGPTGSGKSTLMDAVSLALFGNTPRLTGRKGEPVVAEQMMSRGTGMARAEVEFSKWESGTRQRYRAVWTARRAREKANGNLRHVERSLERRPAGGQWETLVSDHRNRVYQPVFHKVLEGFTTEDFKRSMLLAQGQFDAMLHAKPEERAKILERLTSTDIYQRLGLRAATVAAAWRDRLAGREAQLKAVSPLNAEQLAALRAEVARQQEAVAALGKLCAALDGQGLWLATNHGLGVQLTGAQTGQEAVQKNLAIAKPQLAKLGEHERCEQGFGLLDAGRGIAKQLADNAEEQRQLKARLPTLQRHLKTRERWVGEDAALKDAAAKALADLHTPAAEATAAAKALSDATAEVGTAERAVKKAQDAVSGPEGAAAALKAAEQAKEETAELSGEAASALAAIAGDKQLTEALTSLTETAAGITEAKTQLQRDEADAAAQDSKLSAAHRTHKEEQARHQQDKRSEIAPLASAVKDAAAALQVGDLPVSELQQQLKEQAVSADDRLPKLQAAATITEALVVSEREHLARQAEYQQAKEALDKKTAVVAAHTTQLAALQEAVAKADAKAEPWERVAALTAERDALIAGDDCPLCGSTDHPLVDDKSSDDVAAKIAAARQEVVTARAAATKAGIELAAKREELAALQQAETGAAVLVDKAQRHLQTAWQKTTTALAAAQLACPAPEAGSLAQATALVSNTTTALTTGRSERDAAMARREALAAKVEAAHVADRALAAAVDKFESARIALLKKKVALEQASRALSDRKDGLKVAAQQLEARRGELAKSLGAFGIVTEPAEAGLEQGKTRAAAWQAADHQAQEAKRRADKAEDLVTAKRAALDKAKEELEARTSDRNIRVEVATKAQQASEEALQALQAVWQAALAADEAAATEATTEFAMDAATATEGTAATEATGPDADGPDADGPDTAGRDATDPDMPVRATAALMARPTGELVPAVLVASQRERVAQRTATWQRASASRDVARSQVTKMTAHQASLVGQAGKLQDQRATNEQKLAEMLVTLELSSSADLATLRLEPALVAQTRALRTELTTAVAAAKAKLEAVTEQLVAHKAARPDALSAEATAETVAAARQEAGEGLSVASELLDAKRTRLEIAKRDLAAQATLIEALKADRQQADVWLRLHDLIGKSDGKRFRLFAQALNLDQLLRQANVHLEKLNDRYRLHTEKEPKTGFPTLQFGIEDRWQPGTTRSLKTLSGGESFLVSLALALGLSDLRTSSMPVETLLLDEGFGTLDAHTLDVALAALQQLQASGRQVGIISHVSGLQDSIEARILVQPIADGRSRVVVAGGSGRVGAAELPAPNT